MKLRGFNLSTRITFSALLLVMVGGLLWIGAQNQRLHDAYLSERSADLESALNVEKVRLAKTVTALRQDTVFLADTPPVSGMVRARANHGLDPRDKNSYVTWEMRLQDIFSAFLRAHPDYVQARYIGVADGGRELVHIESRDGRVEVMPQGGLQTKGERDYFKAGLKLHAGQVYLSEFTLNQEWGKIEVPHLPVLRAVTPVFDADGRMFGMVVLNLDVRPMFLASQEGLPAGVQGYIADQQGRYLTHPDVQRAFAFEQGNNAKISDDFPHLKSLIESPTQNFLPLHEAHSRVGGYLAAERVFFDVSDPARFLLLVYHLPAQVVAKQASGITSPIIFNALLVMLLLSAVFMLMLRRTFAPLARITAAAREIAAGNRQLRISEKNGGEIGELSIALNGMLDKLSDHELIKQERDFRNGIINAVHDGYWLSDMQGHLLEVNQAYADISGYTVDELPGMHISQLEAIELSPDEVQAHIAKIEMQGYDLFETRHRHKDGHEIDIEVSVNLMRESQRLVVFCRDISARKQAEKALKESELRWKFAIEGSGDGVWDWNFKTDETTFSKRWKEILGYTEDDVLPDGEGLRALIHPDDQARVLDAMRAYLEGRAPAYTVESRMQCKDGSYKWMLGRGIVISRGRDGQPLRMIGTSADITERKQADERLAYSEALFHGLFNTMSSCVAVYEAVEDGEDFVFKDFNPAAAVLERVNREDVINQRVTVRFPGIKEFGLLAVLQRVWETGVAEHFPVSIYRDNRIIGWRDNHVYRLLSGEVVAVYDDVTARVQAEENLRVAAVAFETHEAILITDVNNNIIRVNQAFQDITGYQAEEVLGKNPRILSSGRQDMQFYADMWQQLLSNGSWTGEIWDRRKSGQVYPKWLTITAVKDAAGKTAEYVAIFSDITARKQAEDEIRNLAFYDALTRLPNRRLLMDRLRLALSVSARSNYFGAVLFLDMDKFKTLNDTLGHDFGDLLLVEVGIRIQSCVRESDTVARLGGDEFVVLIEQVDEHAEDASQKAALIAEKIRASLSVPYQLNGNVHHSSPSIGVCLYRGNDESVDVLLKHADMAMYQAKDSGRNAVRFFDPAMQLAVETRATLEADLRHAVPGRQLQLYYQIQVDSDLSPLGAEALVRWMHPTRGMVSPAQFIPIAEESSLILDIGGWVMQTACHQLGEWAKNEQTCNLILAVNVSAQQFKQVDFVENVAAVLRASRVDASRLKLELTESVVLNDVEDVVAKMHALKALGVRLSMDDFGTGYSSLSYLKNLPLDQIKIDQSFVRDIATDPNDAVMVRTIIDMAQNFRLNVIAEGVETEAQLAFLKEHGCMAYQGYYFSKPVPIEAFSKLLGAE